MFFCQQTVALTKVRPALNTVALTFDDGPDRIQTPKILKILEDYGIKATFYLVGQRAKKMPDLVRAIHESGHAIANHSYTHPYLTKLSSQNVKQEIEKTSDILFDITGEVPRCVRPPYGAISKRVREIIKFEELAVSMWDIDSEVHYLKNETHIVNRVLKARSGDIILFHDLGLAGNRTAKILPQIIEGLQKRGLGFDTICEGSTTDTAQTIKD